MLMLATGSCNDYLSQRSTLRSGATVQQAVDGQPSTLTGQMTHGADRRQG